MGANILVGAQWGDEGKGKIIDFLMEKADWVVRYQGGNNAGHTVEIGSDKYILHLVPSGILRPGKKCIIGHGMVVDPLALAEEMRELEKRGVSLGDRLYISDRAQIVMPYHRLLDAGSEQRLAAGEKIGTTRRGIGPAYADKVSRTGLRFCDLLESDIQQTIRLKIERSNEGLAEMGMDALDIDDTVSQLTEAAEYLKPCIADTIVLLNAAWAEGDSFLFEGAQGTMLDIDYGSYPFVTSSSSTAGGAATGSGLAPHRIDSVLGVLKAYTTRVGEGPMPTELEDETGEKLRSAGGEYGATTGRPRRCGWFDAVVARHAAMINGIDRWAMTKLDVLDELDAIKICIAYEIDGCRIEHLPASARLLERCVPIYEEIEGWKCSISDRTDYRDLPEAAKRYISLIEKLTGVKTGFISVGPMRDSTIVRDSELFT